jgi:hypothetical protein
MILNFYDKNFTPLKNNASLVVESVKLLRNAAEFDIFSVVAAAHDASINPVFVTLEDDEGGYIYGALAGVPQITSENKTQLNASDLRTLMVGDVVLDFTDKNFGLLKDYLDYLFNVAKEDILQDLYAVDINTDDISTVAFKPEMLRQEKYVADLWTTFKEALTYHECFIDSKLDLSLKKVVLSVKRTYVRDIPIVLSDYGVKNVEKKLAPVNEVQAYSEDLSAKNPPWILLSDNTITQDLTKRDMLPVKRKIFTGDITTAEVEAILELSKHKYQEVISIPYLSGNDNVFYFDATVTIYERHIYNNDGVNTTGYKRLPIGAIGWETGKNGEKRWIDIGYRPRSAAMLLNKLIKKGDN